MNRLSTDCIFPKRDNLCPGWTHSQRRAILTPSFLPTERPVQVVSHLSQINALTINQELNARSPIAPPKYTWQVSSSHTNFSSGCLRHFANVLAVWLPNCPENHQKESCPPEKPGRREVNGDHGRTEKLPPKVLRERSRTNRLSRDRPGCQVVAP